MTALLLTIPGTITTPQLGKYRNGLPDTTDSAMYAAYIFGTDFHTDSSVSINNPLYDLSGNGNMLTQVGTSSVDTLGMQTKGFLANNTNYLNTPFTGDQLSQAGVNNEFSIMAFGLFDPTGVNGGHFLAATTATPPARQFSFRSDGSYNVDMLYYDDVALRQLGTGNPVNTLRVTNNVCVGVTVSLDRLGSFFAGNGIAKVESSVTTTTTGTRQNGGASLIRLGGKNTTTANTKLYGMLFFNRVLTSAEMESIYASMKDFFASYGVSV